jgi:tRNA (cytidine/uridine-2'-O-)-methyltransferase
MDIVLVHPDIPFNTGNVARTCISTDVTLHLIKPLGFSIDDKDVKRAGLDYWKDVKLQVHENWEAFLSSETGQKPLYFFSRFAEKLYWDASYTQEAVLIFGSETEGLPRAIKSEFPNQLYRIPTPGPVRSLNLSTSVGIVLFEALRQTKTQTS